MANKRSYEDVIKIFQEKGCVLTTTRDEYDKMQGVSRSKFQFKALCGHDNDVILTNFISKGSGLYCKKCVSEKVRVLLQEKSKLSADLYGSAYGTRLEYEGYVYLVDVLGQEFDVQKTNEGCLADFMIKPKSIGEDKWLMVQLKTTHDVCHGLYTFNMHTNTYSNCIVICLCTSTKELWLFHWLEVSTNNRLNIGQTARSVFYKNKQHSVAQLIENLHIKYALYPRFKAEHAKVPIGIFQQREQKFRRLREEKLSCLDYQYPLEEGLKHDFVVNGYKVQEKVAGTRKGRQKSYMIFLYCNNGKENNQKMYKSSNLN
jgi:hypothetical protein